MATGALRWWSFVLSVDSGRDEPVMEERAGMGDRDVAWK